MEEAEIDDELLELTLQYTERILKVRPQLKPIAFADFLNTLRCLNPLLGVAVEKFAIPHEMRAFVREYALVDAALLEKTSFSANSSDDAGELSHRDGDTG